MKFFKLSVILMCGAVLSLHAAETNQITATNQIELLQAQMREMQANFERIQNEQRRQIEALSQKVEALTKGGAGNTNAVAATNVTAADAAKMKLESELASELSDAGVTNAASGGGTNGITKAPWSPAQPMPVFRAGSAYMNISFDALVAAGYSTASDPSQYLELGDHDPIKRGFSLRNAEIALDGAVDPYFKGFANLVFKLDKNNETSSELEETYFQTAALPGNFQVKGGQFFANFGRQNSQHPHTWAFVDSPLILNRTFGPDGLRGIGVQPSWLAPTPFYTELSLGILDGQGGTAFGFRNTGDPDSLGINRFHGRATVDRNMEGPQDLVYNPRLATSFDLTDTQTLVLGTSGAFGPNDTGDHNRTEIYGADVFWKWKPVNAREGFPFVSWQTEALYQRFGASADPTAPLGGLPGENLRDYGFYSQVQWGFRPRWVAGLRGDYVTGNKGAYDSFDVFRGDRSRISPMLTWYPTEFSKIRLQYNYDQSEYYHEDHSVWLQMEFLLGAHGAHKF